MFCSIRPTKDRDQLETRAHAHGYQLYVYHPYQFGFLPTADETDMLVILGGPMSPNDDLAWIKQERALIQELLANETPIFGACFGAQQITKTLGTRLPKVLPRKLAGHRSIGNPM